MYQPIEQRSWFRRNLKWLIPVGCMVPLLACAGIVAFVVVVVFGAIKSSDAYTGAMERVSSSEAVQEALGTPVEAGWLVSGSINVSGSSGNADLTIPISGPKGSGKLYVVATKSADRWRYSTLEVAVDGSGDRIDLLADSDGRIEEYFAEAREKHVY
jgi:Cytochrome oxidase complex assembly protein 1